MRKNIILILLLIFNLSYAMELNDIKIKGASDKFSALIEVNKIDTTKIKYKTLYNPYRVYVDFIDTKKHGISNFVRKFDKNLPITSVRSYYHKKLGEKKNITRVVFDLNDSLVKSFKVIKNSEGKVYAIAYLKNKMSKISFSWNTNLMNKVVYNREKDNKKNKKVDKKTSKLLDVEFVSLGKQNDIVFNFNDKAPVKDVKIDSNHVLFIKFKSSFLNSKYKNFVYSNNKFGFNKIESLGKINEYVAFKIFVNKNMVDTNLSVITQNNKIVVSLMLSKKSFNFIGSLALLKTVKFNLENKKEKEKRNKKIVKTALAAEKVIDSSKTIIVISNNVKIRKGPDSKFDVIGVAKKNDLFEYILEKGDYIKIVYKNQIGWLFKSGTKKLKTEKIKSKNMITFRGVKLKYVVIKKVSVRMEPSLKSKKLGYLNINDTVFVTDKNGDWLNIVYKGKMAWANYKFLRQFSKGNILLSNIAKKSTKLDDSTSTIFGKRKLVTFSKYKNVGPFVPRLKKRTLESGPNVEDLQLVGIIYDELDKIALFQSKNKVLEKSIFAMREGDSVKNGKLYKIEKDKVVFMLTIFGVTKTYIIKLENKKK